MDEDYLLQFSMLNPPKQALGRTKEVEEKYDKCIKNGSNIFFLDTLKKMLKYNSPLLLENMFPYDTKDNIKHYCIWYSEPFDVERFLKDNNLKAITYFENDISLKSIKDISHIHVFVKT